MELSVCTLCHRVFTYTVQLCFTPAGSFLLTCLATHVAALKTLLFNTEEPNSSHSIRILPLSPPPFPSSFVLNFTTETKTSRVSGEGCQCSFCCCKRGSRCVFSLNAWLCRDVRLSPWSPGTRRSFLHGFISSSGCRVRTVLISLLGPSSN